MTLGRLASAIRHSVTRPSAIRSTCAAKFSQPAVVAFRVHLDHEQDEVVLDGDGGLGLTRYLTAGRSMAAIRSR